jgi:uncharacterized protein YlxW (UPF0749 family)
MNQSNLEAKLNSSPDMLSDMMNVFEQVALLKSEKAKLSKLNKELEDKNEQLNNQVTDLTNKLSLLHSSTNTGIIHIYIHVCAAFFFLNYI